MIKALAIKELREHRGTAALGLAAELFLVAVVIGLEPFARIANIGTPGKDVWVPFLMPSYFALSCSIAALLAIALGFRQSAWENSRSVYQFLLHRPIRRETIFLTKLGTGLGIFLVCTGLPISLYAVWAAIPGTHPSPFEWSMAGRSWQAGLVVPLLYGGAFLSGLRQARWFGSRLFPLVGTLPPVIRLLTLQYPWYWGLALAALLYAALATNICFVARTRDYI